MQVFNVIVLAVLNAGAHNSLYKLIFSPLSSFSCAVEMYLLRYAAFAASLLGLDS